ncbi:MAG: ABC transporter permease [Gemmatimonadota bacterium]
MLKHAVLWLRSNFERRRHEKDMREEMDEHLERATRLLLDRGLGAEEARRQAQREFGDLSYHQMYARDARGTLWLDDLKADSRFALRHFARKPGTTVMMLIVLAFGMSVSTLLFSFLHGFSNQPLPAVTLEDDLVRIRGSRLTSSRFDPVSPRRFREDELLAYRNLTSHFTSVAGWIEQNGVMQIPEDPARLGYEAELNFVTENYFRVLDVQPVLGVGLPTVAPDDPAANAVAVIDYDTWRDQFGQRRDVLGSAVTLNGVSITIVGVAPPRFGGFDDVQVWLPLGARSLLLDNPDDEFRAVARLRPGVTRAAATTAVQTIAARADTIVGETIIRQPGANVAPLLAQNGAPEFEADIGKMAMGLGGLGTLVLLVTCINVSGLLTGLASARRREIAVRLSLGAPRTRIIRQLLTESAVLALVAGAGALAVVAIFLRVAMAMVPDVPLELKIEWPTTAFTFAIALAVGIVFGLSPALHATRLAIASVLRDSGGGIASARSRLQRGLVVTQIALTQPLIVLMTTMLVLTLAEMKPITEANAADRVVTLRVQTPTTMNWDDSPESMRKQVELMLRLREQVRATPGIETAVIDWRQTDYPGIYTAHSDDKAGGRPDATADLAVHFVEAAHFDVMGIPIKRGRTFGPGDLSAAMTSAEAPGIIGADLAAQLWGNADPVGRRLQTVTEPGNGSGPSPDGGLRTVVVIGVVDDPYARTRDDKEPYRVYLPADTARSAEYMLIRSAVPPAPLVPIIRGLAQNAAASSIINLETLADVEAKENRDRRRISGAFSAGGIVALLLSAIGLYAVIAFTVTQRTQEIAVRLAVGANRNQITYSFIREALRLGAFGLVLGLPVGLFAMRQLVAVLGMGELPTAPIILVASTGIFLVAAASAWGPARRAAGVDPATALRRG